MVTGNGVSRMKCWKILSTVVVIVVCAAVLRCSQPKEVREYAWSLEAGLLKGPDRVGAGRSLCGLVSWRLGISDEPKEYYFFQALSGVSGTSVPEPFIGYGDYAHWQALMKKKARYSSAGLR